MDPETTPQPEISPPKCWLCGNDEPTIKTAPQAPDWQTWWFHKDCYWKLQDILN